jgi:hypothetical protein
MEPKKTPVFATDSEVENGDENIHVNHDDSPRSDDPKCGPGGRRLFAISAILLIVVAITVPLVVLLPSEPPTPPPYSLSELLASTSSDEDFLDVYNYGLNGTIPTEIGEFTNLSEYYIS